MLVVGERKGHWQKRNAIGKILEPVHEVERLLDWDVGESINLDGVEESLDCSLVFWEEGEEFVLEFVEVAIEGEEPAVFELELRQIFGWENLWVAIESADMLPKRIELACWFCADNPVGAAIDILAFSIPASALSTRDVVLLVNLHIKTIVEEINPRGESGYSGSDDYDFWLVCVIHLVLETTYYKSSVYNSSN